MVSAISNATQTQPVAQSMGASTQKPTQSKPQSATSMDSVQLSQAAQAMLAALQEASPTFSHSASRCGAGTLPAVSRLISTRVCGCGTVSKEASARVPGPGGTPAGTSARATSLQASSCEKCRLAGGRSATRIRGTGATSQISRTVSAKLPARRNQGLLPPGVRNRLRLAGANQPGADLLGLVGGGISARKTPALSEGRSSTTVFHTVSTSTLS